MGTKKPIDEAYACLLEHDFEQAVAWFEKALEAEPDNPSYHYKLSITYARSNKLAKALEHAARAVQLDPGAEPFRLQLSHLEARERVQQARAWLSSPDKASVGRAIALLKEAEKADPLLVQAKLFLGIGYAALGNYEQAVAAVREAVRLDAGDETAQALLTEYRHRWRMQLES